MKSSLIDIHSHILPSLDDGSPHIEESLEMAKVAVKEGIQTIIATPHHGDGRYWNDAAQVQAAVQQLQSVLDEAHIPLQIAAGQEIRVYGDLVEDIHRHVAMTLAGSRYILLEFPSSSIPRQIEELVHELSILQLTPIIAHPERNAELARHPERLQELIEMGALSQITSHSINGFFGKTVQEHAIHFCKQNMAHVIASDAHNVSLRAFGLEQAYANLVQHLDASTVQIYQQNAEAILHNEEIEMPSFTSNVKKWYHFWK